MACAAYYEAKSYTPDTPFTQVQSDIYNDGIGCINTNMPSCSVQCTNLTKTATACYSCLGQLSSCPGSACLTTNVDCSKSPTDLCCQNRTGSCCPLAELAVQCGSCLASGGNTPDAWQSCQTDHGLSAKTLLIIVVCCVVAAAIVIAVVVVVVRE